MTAWDGQECVRIGPSLELLPADACPTCRKRRRLVDFDHGLAVTEPSEYVGRHRAREAGR